MEKLLVNKRKIYTRRFVCYVVDGSSLYDCFSLKKIVLSDFLNFEKPTSLMDYDIFRKALAPIDHKFTTFHCVEHFEFNGFFAPLHSQNTF